MFDTGEEFIRAGQAEFERSGFASEFGWELDGAGGDDDGAASASELFREFTQAAADFVVFTVATKIFEEEDAVALNCGDIRQRGFGRLGVVDRSAVEASQAERNAPGVKRNAEVGGDSEEELFDAALFGGFDGENGMAGVNEETKVVAFGGVRILAGIRATTMRVEFGGRVHADLCCAAFIDRAVRVP